LQIISLTEIQLTSTYDYITIVPLIVNCQVCPLHPGGAKSAGETPPMGAVNGR
jgi:hypothetical protein